MSDYAYYGSLDRIITALERIANALEEIVNEKSGLLGKETSRTRANHPGTTTGHYPPF